MLHFFANFSFSLLQPSCYKLYICFRIFCYTSITRIISFNCNETITCENCGIQTTKLNLFHHKKCCSVRTLLCTQCLNFSTKFQTDLNYHIPKKPSETKHGVISKNKGCYLASTGFYSLRQQKNPKLALLSKQQIMSPTRSSRTRNKNLKEELRTCQHFLVDFESKRARQKVLKFAVEKLKPTKVDGKHDHFFKNLQSGAKVNLILQFKLKNKKDWVLR